MKAVIAQLNPVVGDIKGNLARLVETVAQGQKESPDLVIFPELFLTGYPPRDLLERSWFRDCVEAAVEEVVKVSAGYPDTGLIFGAPYNAVQGSARVLYNAAFFVHNGKVIGIAKKVLLPAYDIFDESRYFTPGEAVEPVPYKGARIGLTICEDAWNDPQVIPGTTYRRDPVAELADKGATHLINISASPFNAGKDEIRYRIMRRHCEKHRRPVVMVNQVGGNDELIFDGRSMAFDAGAQLITLGPAYKEKIIPVDLAAGGTAAFYQPQDEVASVHDALVLGLSDYMRKCGFSRAVIGLSGGIDSALVAAIAKEAIGAANIQGVTMPGPYSSKSSIEDSRILAARLGIGFEIIPIVSIFDAYLKALKEQFAQTPMDVAEENIQARIRGNILMALANKFGYLVLATGNKSELAVGYCTLYGDMSGGLAVISDVPKTLVYRLAGYINRTSEVIPASIIAKPPSAELRPNQRDQDTLPPYEILDPILQYYIEEGYSEAEIVKLGYKTETVQWVVKTIKKNEYKRLQAAPGLKVTSKAFGVGRRMPVAARFES